MAIENCVYKEVENYDPNNPRCGFCSAMCADRSKNYTLEKIENGIAVWKYNGNETDKGKI